MISKYILPTNTTMRDYAIELTSWAYQAAWIAYSDTLGIVGEESNVHIPTPMSRAKDQGDPMQSISLGSTAPLGIRIRPAFRLLSESL